MFTLFISTYRPIASGRSLGGDWRRRPGRPRARWTDQLRNDTGSVTANLWRQTDRPFYEAMVERRDGPSWLRDDDNDDDLWARLHSSIIIIQTVRLCWRIEVWTWT